MATPTQQEPQIDFEQKQSLSISFLYRSYLSLSVEHCHGRYIQKERISMQTFFCFPHDKVFSQTQDKDAIRGPFMGSPLPRKAGRKGWNGYEE